MSPRVLLALALGALTAPLAGGCGDGDCAEPTLVQCQDPDWLEGRCGVAHRQVMRTNPEATCNVLLAENAAQETEGLPEEELAIPDDLGGGVTTGKVVPNPEAGPTEVDLPSTFAGRSQRASARATTEGLSAEDRSLRATWNANDLEVASCEEYVYEKYLDYMQFKDALAGKAQRYPEIAEAAFGASSESPAIGTRGAAGVRLRMKEGIDQTVQAPESGYVVDVDPDGDCYPAWQRIRLDNVFFGMPSELVAPEDWMPIRNARCYHQDIDSPGYTPLAPELRWQWHQTRLAEAGSSGYALVELDANYEKVREFQRLLTSYRRDVENPVVPECCSDPGSECCDEYNNQRFAIRMRLQELFEWARSQGCLELGTTPCSWSPNHFVVSLEDSFDAAMEADYQRCLIQTGDDFLALKSYQFTLPDASHTVWPSPSECDSTYAETWPTCPVDDYTVTASAVDRFAARWAEFDGPLEEYLKSTMPRDLIDAQGNVRLPGYEMTEHHEAGNSKFGVFYGFGMGWSLPGIESVDSEDSAQLCRLGPQASAHFYLGGWAFGSDRLYAIDASYRAGMDGNLERSLSVLGQTIWQETIPGTLINSSGYTASVQVVPPKFCASREECGEGLKQRFLVAGIPMSVTGAIAGSVGLGAELSATQAAEYTPGTQQQCWDFSVQVEPRIGLDAVASLNVLDSGAITAGLSVTLTMVQLSLPFRWSVSEQEVNDPVDGQHLQVTVEHDVTLALRLLAGAISVFVAVDLGLFSMSYSYKLFGWNGIPLEYPLIESRYACHLNRLLLLLE